MSDVVIKVENLSKKYVIGHQRPERYQTFRDTVAAQVRGLGRRLVHPLLSSEGGLMAADEKEEFYALRDVCFEIKRGDRVGIIGRNGAGKSTLLKILSRITEPTSGRIEIDGRVASLLEVGTGFHPELTGRENIFLNGAILGMTREEIKRKFDEIVAFAEIEKFLDTPVKRYSSGMYVRLAFAVAAHLEPEILIVDEVLAVGDAQFQKKCLGKMEEVGKEGRTVLFVSHNMQALQRLCPLALLLKQGNAVSTGKSEQVIAEYLRDFGGKRVPAWEDAEGIGDSDIKLVSLKVISCGIAAGQAAARSSQDVQVVMELSVTQTVPGLCVGFDLIGRDGSVLLRSYDTDVSSERFLPVNQGVSSRRCIIPAGTLNGGRYALAPRIGVHNQRWIVNCEPLVEFDVILDHGQSDYWNVLDGSNRPGLAAPILDWVL